MKNLRYYLPSFILFALAALVLVLPFLAVGLVVGTLTFFGVIYFITVRNLLKSSETFQEPSGPQVMSDAEFYAEQAAKQPTFKNVTIEVVRFFPG